MTPTQVVVPTRYRAEVTDPAGDPRIEFAFNLAQDELASGFAAIDELRGRVGTLLSAASIATGFLAGQALNTSRGIPGPAWLGIAAALLLVAASSYILWPRKWAGARRHALEVIENARNDPGQSIDDFRIEMVGFINKHVVTNDERRQWLYRAFSASLLFLCLDFAGWIWTLATN